MAGRTSSSFNSVATETTTTTPYGASLPQLYPSLPWVCDTAAASHHPHPHPPPHHPYQTPALHCLPYMPDDRHAVYGVAGDWQKEQGGATAYFTLHALPTVRLFAVDLLPLAPTYLPHRRLDTLLAFCARHAPSLPGCGAFPPLPPT